MTNTELGPDSEIYPYPESQAEVPLESIDLKQGLEVKHVLKQFLIRTLKHK